MPKLQASVTTTTTHAVKLSPAVKRELLTKLKTYASLKTQRDAIDHAMKGHRTGVEEIMEKVGEASLSVEGFKTTIIAPVRKGKFNPKKAVALGIPMEKILKAMDPDEPGTSYVKITVPGSAEDDD
jgi:hypothetical protein